MCNLDEYTYFKVELDKIIAFLNYTGPLFIRLPTRVDPNYNKQESVSLLSSI